MTKTIQNGHAKVKQILRLFRPIGLLRQPANGRTLRFPDGKFYHHKEKIFIYGIINLNFKSFLFTTKYFCVQTRVWLDFILRLYTGVQTIKF